MSANRARPKPASVFDRDVEWRALATFASGTAPQARFGIVSGRRRMGKTYLLRALVDELGGFYFGATEATAGESLRQFGAALAEYVASPVPFSFANWDDAITYLFTLGSRDERPVLAVLDEFPYLARAASELPSLIQREIDKYQSRENRLRLLLCGSALSVMGGLLASSAPLRGRASVELLVRPFEYLDAAAFWEVDRDPRLAARLHAVVGGTPAYRRQFLADDTPADLDDFSSWVSRTVLSPVSPLFREARYLLAEEADIRDAALYHSVLAGVAAGNTTRGGIAGYVGRKSVDIAHPLHVLEDCHLLAREPDVFRSGRSQYRITEPLITFYESIMRPSWGRLEAGHAESVWREAETRFSSQVLGPHFEALCRDFMLARGHRLLGDQPMSEVGAGVVTDSARKQQIQIDVAVLAPGDGAHRRRVIALGEVKWGTTIGPRHVDRLARARDVLLGQGYDAEECRLLCFSASGFEPEARTRDSSVELIGLDALYE